MQFCIVEKLHNPQRPSQNTKLPPFGAVSFTDFPESFEKWRSEGCELELELLMDGRALVSND
jgi:hypothetical protein